MFLEAHGNTFGTRLASQNIAQIKQASAVTLEIVFVFDEIVQLTAIALESVVLSTESDVDSAFTPESVPA